MKQGIRNLILFGIIFLQACAGTDLIDDPIIGEKLSIQPRIDSLPIGKEQVFSVKFSNKFGIEEKAPTITWRSSNSTKISVDATGKVKALALGKATIYATTGTVTDSIVLNRNSDGVSNPNNNNNNGNNNNNSDTTFLKRGVFKPATTSYSVAGNVRVQIVKGVSQIVTESNFNVSAGPSLYLLLTNHTNGRYTVTSGGNAISAASVQITANRLTTFTGAMTWNIPGGVNPADYKFVVLYCTLGPVFGTAELQ
jgi:hypothetical protein